MGHSLERVACEISQARVFLVNQVAAELRQIDVLVAWGTLVADARPQLNRVHLRALLLHKSLQGHDLVRDLRQRLPDNVRCEQTSKSV